MSYIEFSHNDIAGYYRRRIPSLRQAGSEWRGPCPIHGGKGSNFAVNPNTGQWCCHSQCGRGGDILTLEQELFSPDFKDALQSVGEIIGRELSSSKLEHRHEYGALAVFTYTDEDGEPLFEVCRQDCLCCPDKKISQRRPDGTKNVTGVRRVLYNLPALSEADRVFLPEGEPKVHALDAWDLVATCNAGGANKWDQTYSEALRDKEIILLPDNDAPGKRHALAIARQLLDIAGPVRILELPGLPPKGDIVDWQESGHTRDEFLALVENLQSETIATLNARESDWGFNGEAMEGRAEAKPTGPGPMGPEAFYGVAGDFVRIVEPHTEADPAALLLSFLVAVGNYLPRTTYYLADGSKHYPNEFVAIVGDTAKGRKGTSWNRVRDVLQKVDPEYLETRCISGLSTGEGVIWAVRDPIISTERIKRAGETRYEDAVVDSGVTDKRLLVVEGEFARALKAMQRDSNTLSAILREGWDHGSLNILTKSKAATATNAHISIVAHITIQELRKLLSETESANGFANRFLWIYATRSKELPLGGSLQESALDSIAARVREVADFGNLHDQLRFDQEAAAEWVRVYPQLSSGGTGLAGMVTSRSEAHAVRLATLYAILDLSPSIQIQHLRAALAVVDYSNRSVEFIFGKKLGDDTADEILRLLTDAGPPGRTRNDIYEHFGRNKKSGEISRALALLKQHGLVEMRLEDTGGRKAERWNVIREKVPIPKKSMGRAESTSGIRQFISA